MFPILEASELSGFPSQTLRNHAADGLIVPAVVGGPGRTGGHQFSKMQTLGLMVAKKISDGEQGCHLSYIGKVVEAFGNVTEEWMLNEWHTKGSHFVMAHKGKPIFQGLYHIDVRPLFNAVDKAAAKKAKA